MKTLVYSILLFLFVHVQTNAQSTDGYGSVQLTSFANGNAVLGIDGNSNVSTLDRLRTRKNIEGSPFYNEEWLTGTVLIDDNLKSEDVMLKYTPYQNLVFFKNRDGGNTLALNNQYVTGFILNENGEKKLFKNGFSADDEEINKYTFFRVLHDGELKLLVHHRTYIRESKTNPFASGTISNEYRHKEDHYLKTADSEKLHDIELKDKDLFEHIDEKYHNQLEEYAEENDLDFGEEKGFANILAYYEQLQKQDK